MIKAVIFDCFGVLYVDTSRHFFEHHVPDYERLHSELDALLRACDRGYITQRELNQQIAVVTGLSFDFVNERIQGVHQRNDTLLSYAQSLRSTYKLGMLSNIGRGSMDSFFDGSERQRLFDAVILSGEVGMIKPDPAIFTLMAEKLEVLPEECVMIDDIVANVDGAKAAGMQSVVYSTTYNLQHALSKLDIPLPFIN
ncbi:MAG: HAD family phosphatase [Candidatus Saccharimonadales bacterium]